MCRTWHLVDTLSRFFKGHLEWKLQPSIFNNVVVKLGAMLTVDLSASRSNNQLKSFVSWLPDPVAMACDAFAMSWTDELIYAFPPFALIARVLQEIDRDGAKGILIFPLWQTQHWFPRMLRLLTAVPVILLKTPVADFTKSCAMA